LAPLATFLRSRGSAALPDWSPGGAGVFAESFVSTGQTITSGGSLVLAHSLTATPTLIIVTLINGSSEGGYSANDRVIVNPHQEGGGAANRGVSIVPDGTNLNIRFGSNTQAFEILNKTDGNTFVATNGNWTAEFAAHA